MPRKEPKNEQALCMAVMRLICNRRGQELVGAEQVDTVSRQEPAVEWRFGTPTARFALEHTRIESFPGQIESGKQFARLLGPLESELRGRLPGEFELVVQVGAAKAPIGEHLAVRTALTEWILGHADELEALEESDCPSGCELDASPASVPFPVMLRRISRERSEMRIIQGLQGDLGAARRVRIRHSFDRKCPKLARERSTGHITILILESDDIGLGNRRDIVEGVLAELPTQQDVPDMILFARTSTRPWVAWFIKEHDLISPRIEKAGPFVLELTAGDEWSDP